MDKITLFDVLSFLLPGAILLSIIHVFTILNSIEITSILIENQPILSSFLFLSLSYISGFVISNIANFFYNKAGLYRNTFAQIANKPKNERELKLLNEFSIKNYGFGFINSENGLINENELNKLFTLWYETLEMKTDHNKSRVLHSHHRMFSNLLFIILLAIIAYLITAVHLFLNSTINIFTFKYLIYGCILLLFLYQSYRISTIRFEHFTMSIFYAIIVYFVEKNIENNKI